MSPSPSTAHADSSPTFSPLSPFGDAESLSPHYHYVIVRADLPRGLQVAQVVHASGESAANRDVPDGTHAVVLQVNDEEHLLYIAEQLWKSGFKNDDYVVIVEPDLPPTGHAYDGQFTAIGICPTTNRKKITSTVIGRLPLLR